MTMIYQRARRVLQSACLPTFWLASSLSGLSLTYHISYLEDEGRRGQITAVMDEAVAVFNAHSNIDVDINVIYHSGIPTAQANYNGELGFGGSISTQVALHEIAHYLGSGTTWEWDAGGGFNGGDVWQGVSGQHFVKLFDGPWADIRKSGVHYYPYGLNFGNEDNPQARIRLVKIVTAMRADMGLAGGGDWDGDGLPNGWEMWRFGDLSQTGAGDTDGDGISNADERLIESDPTRPCPIQDGHTYVIRARHSGRVMEVAGGSIEAGANVVQYDYNGTDGQKWTAHHDGDGYWKFLNLRSGKALEVLNYSADAGASLIQWNDTGGANQRWRVVPNGAVYSKVFNKHSRNMVIDVDGGPGAVGNNANISQYFDILGGTNQDWTFEDVTPGAASVTLMAEYKLDGNSRDSSGRGLHGAISGGVTYSTGRVDAQAATFNGVSGSIKVPASVSSNFSISCWVKTSALADRGQWYNGMGIVDAEVPGVAKDFGLAMINNRAAFGVGDTDVTVSSGAPINDGNWHHLAATLNTTTGSMRLYVDGALDKTASVPAGARVSPESFHLGSIGGVTGFFDGSLDEVRIYRGLLSAAEVSRLANIGQTRVASYDFDGDMLDRSQHGNHGLPNAVSYIPGKSGSGAVQFDGIRSFATIPASVTDAFSVAYWVKTTTTANTGQWWEGKAMIDSEVAGTANDWGISLVGDKIGFGVGNADSTILSTTPINDGTWHHVIATRSATGQIKVYIDGSLEASANGSEPPRNAPSAIRLGGILNGGGFFTGAIDELKIFNYTLSSSQAAALTNETSSPLTGVDIGNPGSDGFTGYSSSEGATFTLIAGGSDPDSPLDQLQLAAETLSGNQSAVAQVRDATPAAEAGLMFRDSTAPGSPYVQLAFSATSGLRLLHRDTGNAAPMQTGSNVLIALPVWMKLTRAGDTFAAFYATTTDLPANSDWQFIGAHASPMVTAPLVGMAARSLSPGEVATTRFVSFATSPTPPAEIWRQENFGSVLPTGAAADDQDPDFDTIPNLLERAFGLNPTGFDGPDARPTLVENDDFLSIAYTKDTSAVDLDIVAKWSSDLSEWHTSDLVDELLFTEGAIEHRVAKVPMTRLDPDKAFIRLDVE